MLPQNHAVIETFFYRSRIHSEAAGRVGLGVHVDEQYFMSLKPHGMSEVNGSRGFSHSAFLIDKGVDTGHLIYDFRFWIYDFSRFSSLNVSRHHHHIRREDCRNAEQAENLLTEHPTLLVLHPLEEELLERMKQKTRYNIRLAEKKGVSLRVGKLEDLPMLYKMYAETSVRDGFVIRDEGYYNTVWTLFMNSADPTCEPLIAEVDGMPVESSPAAGPLQEAGFARTSRGFLKRQGA